MWVDGIAIAGAIAICHICKLVFKIKFKGSIVLRPTQPLVEDKISLKSEYTDFILNILTTSGKRGLTGELDIQSRHRKGEVRNLDPTLPLRL